MNYSGVDRVTLGCYNKELVIMVSYNYSFDPGVHTYSNGDPGYPPSEELEITDVTDEYGNDLEPMFNRMDSIFSKKKGYKSIWERVSESTEPEAPEPDFD